ncbi:MAG TPA: DNA polymerase III subunit delta [Bacteroidia bacterium]|nr:DNA polymerase III subunit delta [Bacteroidia bacterium]
MKEVNQILTDLKRKIFKPVYFLSGEEAYYIDLISDYIEKNALDESEQEFNQTILYGKDVDLNAIISAAKRFPMMSEYQVVIVKEAQNLKELGKASGGDDEDDDIPAKKTSTGSSNALASYLQQPQSSTILVFCYKYKTLDKRSSVYKSLQKNHVFLETKKMYDNQIPEWITSFVQERKFKIGPKASFLLAEFLGNDLSKITNEVEKLLINLEEGDEITPEAVQDNIGISKEFNVFELQDALAKKDILKANRIINYFSANEKEHPAVMTLSTLYGYFSKILLYHFCPDKSKFAVAQALGVNPFFVDGYAKAAQNYGTAKLKAIFSYLKEYDLKTKGVDNSGVSNGELMKELIFKILH